MSTHEWIMLLFIVIGALNTPFALGIYRHGKSHSPVLAPAEAWAALAIVGGVFVVVAYWLLHMSTLARSTTITDDISSRTA